MPPAASNPVLDEENPRLRAIAPFQRGEIRLRRIAVVMDGDQACAIGRKQHVDRCPDDLRRLVRYQDERMTTVTAERVLISGSVRRENRKQYVDKLAAAVILEQWLASQSGAAERGMTYGE